MTEVNYSLPLNDLLDIVEELTNMVEELNPGATEQIRRIRFLTGRAESQLNPRDGAGMGNITFKRYADDDEPYNSIEGLRPIV